jgi:hypothetical protein
MSRFKLAVAAGVAVSAVATTIAVATYGAGETVVSLSISGAVELVESADFNGDGRSDLLIALGRF